MDESDGPAILRRRRRIARHQRERTPNPDVKPNGQSQCPMYSDEESSSTTTDYHQRIILTDDSRDSRNGRPRTNMSNTAYRNKILSYRDRNLGNAAVVRSRSTPRSPAKQMVDEATETSSIRRNGSSNQVLAFFQQAKRSLSIPRSIIHLNLAYMTIFLFISFLS